MAIDIGALVAPLSEEEPSGPDLYADPVRQQIEAAFERSISADSVGGDDIDWGETVKLILAQAEQTRDLWLATYLMRAAAQQQKFETLCDAADWLAALSSERWADVHPQLDEVGFIGRKAPCESLTRIGEFLGPLREVPLIAHERLGSFSGSDFERFVDEGAGADGFGQFRALVEATPVEELQNILAQVDRLVDAIQRTDQIFTENAEGDSATNFEPTYQALDKIRRAVKANLPPEATGEEPDDPVESDGPVESGDGAATAPKGAGFSGGINNRNDVARAIDAICAYYEKYEPGSPVPLVLRRARDWISLDFMAVLEDIAPGSLSEAGSVLKSQRVRENNSYDSGSSSDSDSSSSDGW